MGIFEKITRAILDAIKKRGPHIERNGMKIPVRQKTPIEKVIDKLQFEVIE